MSNKYFFNIDKKWFKQGYVMIDENKNVVYEAKMTKLGIFTSFKFEFVNHLTNKTTEHKVGHTSTLEQSGVVGYFATKSNFKFDGKKVWDYLHEQGIRIETSLANGRLGMSYSVTLKGKEMATITMANPKGKKSFITTDFSYDVETDEENIDMAFLTAFALARTNQVFYD